jgi:RAD54-like protein 2
VLHNNLKGFVQRRDHAILQNSLCRKHEYVLNCRLGNVQCTLYQELMRRRTRGDIECNLFKTYDVPSSTVPPLFYHVQLFSTPLFHYVLSCSTYSLTFTNARAAARYTACAKIWNHPDLVHVDPKPRSKKKKKGNGGDDDDEDDVDSVGVEMMWAKEKFSAPTNSFQDSPKFLLCYGIVFKACSLGDRTLVFSQSLETLNLLERLLQVNMRALFTFFFWSLWSFYSLLFSFMPYILSIFSSSLH